MKTPVFRSPYPDYDVLAKRDSPSWNDVTRKAVDARIERAPSRRFFSESEWTLLQAVVARLLPQPERVDGGVPIVPWIDAKLYEKKSDGTRYEDLPEAPEAYRRALSGIDEDSRARFDRRFEELHDDERDALLRAIQQGEVHGAAWNGMSAAHFFSGMLLGDVCAIYYAHPSAWSEIGFGGPASPRGYARLQANLLDPWEAVERREDEP